MRPSQSLTLPATQAEKRLSHLRALVDALPVPPDATQDRIVAFAVIEALNTWTTFARSFYLSCVFRATRSSGAKVSLGASAHIKSKADAIDFAVRTVKPGYAKSRKPPWDWRDEPTWYDPRVVLKLAPALALSNTPEIFAAFGIPSVVFDELPKFRNFFAHRSEDTANKVRKLISDQYKGHGFSSRTTPAEFLCTRLRGRPQSILADYVDDLRNVIALMPQ